MNTPVPTDRKRKRRRWIRRVAVACPIVVVLLVVVLTQTPLFGWFLLPRVERAIGGGVEAQRVRLRLDGSIELTGVRMTAPGVRGAAAVFLEVDRLRARPRWLATLFGSPSLRAIEFERPVARVSVESGAGTLNVASLRGSGGGGWDRMPSISAEDGRLEFGEHDAAGDYTVLKKVRVDGTLTPSGDPQMRGGYVVRLDGTAGSQLSAPIDLTGAVTSDGVNLTLEPVTLEDWPVSAAPSGIRELYKTLDLTGDVGGIDFAYSDAEGISARVRLGGVSLTLPFEDYRSADGRYPRMTDVKGWIEFSRDSVEADLRGLVEDLPYNVVLHWYGTDLDSAFQANLNSDDFRLAERPSFVLFAPPIVREQLSRFSGPTAVVNAQVTIERGPPSDDGAGAIGVRGQIELHDGEAAYAGFPYPFVGMNGLATFDDESIHIVNLEGHGPNGGTISASGVIEPPNDNAAVVITVKVEDVPIDAALEEALGPKNRAVVDALFNREKYQALAETGLIMTPGDADGQRRRADELRRSIVEARGAERERLRGELGEIETKLSEVPAFDLGGRIDADIHVTREYGHPSVWSRDVTVMLRDGGMLPEYFPYPILAHDVEIRIDDEQARFDGGEFRALRDGTTVDVSGSVKLNEETLASHIMVSGDDVLVDELLLHALPDVRTNGVSAAEALRRLNVGGKVSCDAEIEEHNHEFTFDVRVDLDGVEARPGAEGRTLRALVRDGELNATERGLDLDIARADLRLETPDGVRDAGRAHVHAVVPYGKGAGEPLDVEAVVEDADAESPVEAVVGIVALDAADRLAELREQHNPKGRLDLTATLTGVGDDVRAEARIDRLREFEFTALDRSVRIASASGSVLVRRGDPPEVEFAGFAGGLEFDGEPAGTIRLDGVAPLGDTGELRVRLDDARFESPAVRGAAEQRLDEDRARLIDEYDPHGAFSLDAVLGPNGAFDGTLTPHELAITRNGVEIAFDGVDGHVEFERGGGRISALTGSTKNWSVALDGAWYGDGAQTSVHTELALSGEAVDEQLLALLPAPLVELIDSRGFRLDGAFGLTGATIDLVVPDDPARPYELRADGDLRFEGASAEFGFPLTDASGTVRFDVERLRGDEHPRFEADIDADRLRYADLHMTDARAQVRSGEEEGVVLVPMIAGDCHGGRVSGSVMADPESYRAQFRLADVRFASVLDDLGGVGSDAPPSEARGRIDAELSVGGPIGETGSRRGRGAFRVHGGRVIDLPVLLPLIEVANLRLPLSEELDLAQGDLYVNGATLAFENISVHSPSIRIVGYGTVTLPERTLDLRFTSQAERRIPVISDLVEGVRDELVTARVTGTLGDEQVKAEQFSGARRLLEGFLGLEPDPQRQRFEHFERSRLGRATRSERELSEQLRREPDR